MICGIGCSPSPPWQLFRFVVGRQTSLTLQHGLQAQGRVGVSSASYLIADPQETRVGAGRITALQAMIHTPVPVAGFTLQFALPLLLLQALGLLHPLAFLGLPALLQFGGALGQCAPVDPLRRLP